MLRQGLNLLEAGRNAVRRLHETLRATANTVFFTAIQLLRSEIACAGGEALLDRLVRRPSASRPTSTTTSWLAPIPASSFGSQTRHSRQHSIRLRPSSIKGNCDSRTLGTNSATSKGQLPPSSHRHLRSESNARHIRERVVIHRKRHQQGRGHVLLLHITLYTHKYDVRLQVTLRGQ